MPDPSQDQIADLLTLPSEVDELGTRFEAAGHELYVVGGSVRDAILGRGPGGDLDFTTDAHPDEIIRVLRGWSDVNYLQGIRFGTVGARRGDLAVEITTFREEVYPDEDRRHPAVTFARDVKADLSRRDFTINAMAVRLPDRLFVDPYRGLLDLGNKRLRTPLDPDVSFTDDPLRMLRAARFVSTLGVAPDPEVVESVRRLRGRLSIVSPERIQGELTKLLLGEHVRAGLLLMVETGLAEEFLPELPALRLEQDPVQKHKDVLAHTLAVVEKVRPDVVLRLAALLHDIGKPPTRQITAEGVQFHHHDVVGARMTEERLKALRYPGHTVAAVRRLVEMHLRFHTYKEGWSDGAVRRYVRDAGELLDPLNQLTRADCTTQNPKRARELARLQDELEERIARLAEEENLARIRPPLNGDQVMEHLGLEPGPVVGEALDHLLSVRMERGPVEDEEAYRLLETWWRERQERGGA